MQGKELSLDRLKQIEIDILQHFKSFCLNNRLKFFLSNGTLLGAVKYKGFIPWDDDIDVLIPRKDYEYLIKEYKDSGKYKLFTPERVKNYAFPYAKLCDMTTRKVECNNNNGVELGVDIDIFPLDIWRKNEVGQAKRQMRRMRYLRLAKNDKIMSDSFFKTLLKKNMSVFCKFLGAPYFVKRIQKGAISECIESDNAGCVIWPVYGVNEILPKDVFLNTTDVIFEGERYPAPIGYDRYLRSLYGEYERDPPLEKQRTHHHFFAYEFDHKMQ